MHPTRGTRTHPKGLQSPLEVRPPHRDTRRVKAVFAGTTCSTSFLRSLLFEHWREALKRVRGIGILGSPYPRSCIASPRYPQNHPLQAPRIAFYTHCASPPLESRGVSSSVWQPRGSISRFAGCLPPCTPQGSVPARIPRRRGS